MTTSANGKMIATLSANIVAELAKRKDRSAWDKGVTAYAIELAESLENWDKEPTTWAELKETLLNGASDWEQYSYGGCALIYDYDIAERLCNPTELKRCKEGAKDPNSRENWCDVQARALRQAYSRVKNTIAARRYFNA